MWDLIVSVPDHCLSFYFRRLLCINLLSSKVYSRFYLLLVQLSVRILMEKGMCYVRDVIVT